MNDDDGLENRGPAEEAEPHIDAEPGEEEENERSGCRRIIMIIIIILILLLLFWPVSRETKKRRDATRRSTPAGPSEKRIGDTGYRVVSGGPLFNWVITRFAKATAVKVSFFVHNLSWKRRNLGYSAVKLIDQNGVSYEVDPGLTENWYESQGRASPWEKDLEPDASRQVDAVFAVLKGPAKIFRLAGRDMDWQATEFTEIIVGRYSTLPPPR